MKAYQWQFKKRIKSPLLYYAKDAATMAALYSVNSQGKVTYNTIVNILELFLVKKQRDIMIIFVNELK